MRTLLCLWVVCALCSACPLQVTRCTRQAIDPVGDPVTGFGGGGGRNLSPPLGIVNTPLSLTVFAPFSACAGDAPVVNATLVDAQNRLVPELTSTAPLLNLSSAVRSTITVLPTVAGQYTLRVAFEPSLGAREFELDVAADGLDRAVTRVPLPSASSCSLNRLWPVSDDTVACEARLAGLVTVGSADGGSTGFAGTQLVVVGNVLWSINATEQLERRVWEDGGLSLTHSISDFPPAATPGMHDVDVALRFASNGRLVRVRVQPDGGADALQYALSLGGTPLAYFTEADDVPYRWSSSLCGIGSCVDVAHLVALEPGFVWVDDPPMNDPFGKGPLQAFARPIGALQGNPSFGLEYEPEALITPDAPFERLPLWLAAGVGRQKVLVSISDGGLELTAWPRADVLRVGRNHVVLSDGETGMVRVVKR